MDAILYGIIAVVYIGLIIWLLQRAEPRFVWSNVLYVILIALAYDSAVMFIGNSIGEGETLYYMNYMRIVLQALVTPLLVIFALAILREANVEWAQRNYVFLLAVLYTLVLMSIEMILSVRELELYVVNDYGVLRYEDPSIQIPVMLLFVTVALLICSISMWLKYKWLWFFAGVVGITILNIVPLPAMSDVWFNVAELLLIVTLFMTKRFTRRLRYGFPNKDRAQQKEN